VEKRCAKDVQAGRGAYPYACMQFGFLALLVGAPQKPSYACGVSPGSPPHKKTRH